MAGEPENLNPYAPPAPQSSTFRDPSNEPLDKIRQERARRAAICMSFGDAGIIIATLMINSSRSGVSINRYLTIGTCGHFINFIFVAVFFFGSLVWSWIQPIQK